MQIGLDGSHHHARFDSNKINAHQRDADPSVDHNALVEHAIQDINQRRLSCDFLDTCHTTPPNAWRQSEFRRSGDDAGAQASLRNYSCCAAFVKRRRPRQEEFPGIAAKKFWVAVQRLWYLVPKFA